jgi:hypothetical protein
MTEIDVNTHLAGLFKNHGLQVQTDNEFVYTDLAGNIKFKARSVYHEIKNGFNSRLDIMAISDEGYEIIECFGDVGTTVEEAIDRNFQNFSLGSLHPILAAFGCADPETLRQVNKEEWSINGRKWTAYVGNLIPKTIRGSQQIPPDQFYQSIERQIYAQPLANGLHWFRGYYCQIHASITVREFLMDNEPLDGEVIFAPLPAMPDVTFYSCRCFVILRRK